MPKIEVTKAQFESLKKLQHELLTQDNRITSDPIFVVFNDKNQKRFASACLTEKGAQEVISMDGHNMDNPNVYVASGYRNPEWQFIREFLMSIKFYENY